MPPQAPDDPFAFDDDTPAPLRSARSFGGQADCPLRKASRPYEVHAAPPGLVRAPGQPLDPGISPGASPPAAPPMSAPVSPATAAPPPAQATAPAPSSIPPKPFLRPRHERFCAAYVLGGNATRAAWDAGYTKGNGPNQGYRLLKRPEIQARIADIQRAIGRGSAADAEAVIGKLEAAYRQAVEAQYFNAAARLVEVQARIAGHLKSRVAAPHSDEKAEK